MNGNVTLETRLHSPTHAITEIEDVVVIIIIFVYLRMTNAAIQHNKITRNSYS